MRRCPCYALISGSVRALSIRSLRGLAGVCCLSKGSAMPGYYSERLSGERLRACYELAPPRVKAYLEAEIEHVRERISPDAAVLELGCGYGRVLRSLAARARRVVGIDTSFSSLRMAREFVRGSGSVSLAAMDAVCMGFPSHSFDLTICIQNGVSAFAVDQRVLVAEAVRVTRPGGLVLFSSYAGGFWMERLRWFELQAAHGLLGELDRTATGNGVIVCKDGFRATTVDAGGFRALAAHVGLVPSIVEVEGSSLFCALSLPANWEA